METAEGNHNFTGTRCHVCTGCGRCVGKQTIGTGKRHMSVVTMSQGAGAPEPIVSRRKERLVTADIGTTTIAMQLYAADGTVEAEHLSVNPQAEYGADVLSRIQAAADATAAQRMREMVKSVIIEGLLHFRGLLQQGESMRMVLAGNTTMIYLLCGYDPAELGKAPFHASHLEARTCEIDKVSCDIFPGLSAFVGGDITAGIYACGLAERKEITLLIDLGTNGEMVLGNQERRIACATAAGPAFEGGVNRGVWGADMVHLLARLRMEGIVDETGLLADEYFDDGILIGDVRVTQASIRAVQLAKAAIRAGICILMQEYGIENDWERIDRVVLAGGFGYYLDPKDAAVIGLLPEELVRRTIAGGNTALLGALRLGRKLLAAEDASSNLAEHIGVADTEILNLAAHPDFEKRYIEYMNLTFRS